MVDDLRLAEAASVLRPFFYRITFIYANATTNCGYVSLTCHECKSGYVFGYIEVAEFIGTFSI